MGHTLVLGATGAGKSFALNFLLVQALQYDPRVLILDLGGSYRWLTQFLGGGYMELSPEGNAGAGFRLRPFSLPAGERTFGFLTGWISWLLRIGGWTLSGEDPSEIRARRPMDRPCDPRPVKRSFFETPSRHRWRHEISGLNWRN